MKKLLSLLFLLPAMMFGQSTISIADNSSSGTYHQMVKQLVDVCGDKISVTEINSEGGAVGNLDKLFNNEVIAAVFHSDVLKAKIIENDDYGKIKTLVALYPEEVHVLALRSSKTKKIGTFSFGFADFNSLAEIGPGYKVGASGGGVYTLKILKGMGHAQFDIAENLNSGADVIAALDSGQIAAAVFVGGAPLPNLQKLPAGVYKFLPIGSVIVDQVSGIYKTQGISINYPNIGSVNTIAPEATIGTVVKRIPALTQAQANLRACLVDKLPELQDTPGYHRKWQQVDAGNHGRLNNWYDLPSTTPQTKRGR